MKAGWRVAPLGELVEISSGGTPSKERDDFWKGEIPWVSPKDMKSDVIKDSEDHISEAAVSGSATRLIKAGALLLVVRSGILARTIPVARAGRDLTINQDIKALTPSAKLDSAFLAHFLKSQESFLLDKVTRGATVHKLDTPVIRALPIPLPPLDEQKRIVAVLDEAFEGLSRARANAEANLADVHGLWASSLATTFAALAGKAQLVELPSVVTADCTLSYGIVQPGDETNAGLPIVRPVDLAADTVGLAGLKRINPANAQGYKRTELQGGELLLCVRGTTGTVSIADVELSGANVTRGIVPIRFQTDKINPRFGFFQFIAPNVQDQIRAKTYGAALMQINIGDLRKLILLIPTLAEQDAICDKLESIRADYAALTALRIKQIAELDTLRQSLLQKAFSGDLT